MVDVSDKNSYFTLQGLDKGIWAAIVEPGSGAAANAAILDLGDATVVVDTFCLPEAAECLREAAERLTNKPVAYVVNTHIHGDHHYGNQAFAGSAIIATEQTREMLDQNPRVETDVWQTALRRQIDGMTKIKTEATDLRVRTALGNEIADKSKLQAAVPGILRVGATLTFTDELIIHGTNRTVRVFTYGGGHTKSDALVYVPDAKVLIAGDLILGRSHPAMLHGDADSWINILRRVEQETNFQRVIPGHGDITDRRSIEDMTNYLTDIQEYVGRAVQSGKDADFWLAKGVPAPYDDWTISHVFEWNFRWLFNNMKSEP